MTTTEPRILERIGLSEVVTPTQSVTQDCALYAKAGVRAIGVWMHKLERGHADGFWIPEQTIDPETVAAAAEAVRSSGLLVSHLILTGFYTLPELDARIAHTRHTLEVAEALGCRVVVVAPGRREGRSYAETRDLAARAIARVLEDAPGTAMIALEPTVPWHADYMNTLGEALELADLIDHPRVGVYPDTFHLWRTGTMLEDIERAGNRILGVHLNDAREGEDHNCLPGDGELPLVEIVRAIEATGYRGTYDNELVYPGSLVTEDPAHWAPEVVVDRVIGAMADVLRAALPGGE